MAKRRRWPWVAGAVVVVALGATAAFLVVRDPLMLRGDHEVEVYALDDDVTTEVSQAPGVIGRAIGMCDADSYYARDGDRKLCLVLSGPLGTVRAARKNDQVTVAASEVPKLKAMAAQDTGSPRPATTLVLMSGGPAALVPISMLTEGEAVEVSALT